jgi:hypothetical protein
MPYEISNNPPPSNSQYVHVSDNNNDKVEIIKDSSGKSEVTDTNKNASLSIEDHDLLVISRTSLSKAEVAEFAQSVKQSFSAKVKDFFHIGSASGEVKEKGRALARTLDLLGGKLPGFSGKSSTEDITGTGSAKYALEDVLHDAAAYADALNAWLAKHDPNPTGDASGPDRDRIQSMRDQRDEAISLLNTVSGKMDDQAIMGALLTKKIPPHFPLEDVPKLKALLIDSTANSLATYSQDEAMFMRGNEYTAFNSHLANLAEKQYAAPLEKLAKDSDAKARQEFREHGAKLPTGRISNTNILQIDELRASLAKDYQAFITGLLGPDKSSARQAAHDFPADALKSLRAIKAALDEQVAKGKISQEKADKRLDKVLNNVVALRTLGPAMSKNAEKAPGMEGQYITARRTGISSMFQMQISGSTFGDKAAEQKDLNDILAPEQAKIDAFLAELKHIL